MPAFSASMPSRVGNADSCLPVVGNRVERPAAAGAAELPPARALVAGGVQEQVQVARAQPECAEPAHRPVCQRADCLAAADVPCFPGEKTVCRVGGDASQLVDGRAGRRVAGLHAQREAARRAPRTRRLSAVPRPRATARGRELVDDREGRGDGDRARACRPASKAPYPRPMGCRGKDAPPRARGPRPACRPRARPRCPRGRAPRGRTRRRARTSCRTRPCGSRRIRSLPRTCPVTRSPGRDASTRASTFPMDSRSCRGIESRFHSDEEAPRRVTVVCSGREVPTAGWPYTAACSPNRMSFPNARPTPPMWPPSRRAARGGRPAGRRAGARRGERGRARARCRLPATCTTRDRGPPGRGCSADTPIDLPSAIPSPLHAPSHFRASPALSDSTKERIALFDSRRKSRAAPGLLSFHSE